MDTEAEEILALRSSEQTKSRNIKNLYQEFADLGYPLQNQITTQQSPGQDRSKQIRDSTAIKGLNRGANGFVEAFIPKEKHFFYIRIRDRDVNELSNVKWWVAKAVQIAHDEIAGSNFDTEIYNNIKSAMGFGTGCLYVEWDFENRKLNFQNWSVANFEFIQDAGRKAIGVILSYKLTAKQIADKYKNPGEKVALDASDVKTQNNEYEIVRIIRKRKKRNPSKKDVMNMPFEDITVNASEKIVIKRSGFPIFPFAVNRWEVGDQEKWGYGCGVQALSDIKDIQQGRKDYQECCQRLLRPAYLTRDIEGNVNMLPDGRTEVSDVDRDVKALSMALPGAFPVNKDELEWRQKVIDSFFYVDIWNMFTSMTGDRRTTLEIQLKYREGLRVVGSPSSRQQSELFSPVLENVIYLLIENGRIEPPPQEVIGLPYSLEYQGELAMAMKESQSRGFERAMTLMANAVNVFPDIRDQVNLDRAMPDILTTYGMKIEHLNTPDEIAAIRADRAQKEQQMQEFMAMQAQSESYKNTQKAPEANSPAAEMAGV